MNQRRTQRPPSQEAVLGKSEQAPVRKSVAPQRIYVQTEEENDADVARAYADVPDDSARGDRRAHQQKTAEDQCDSDPAVGARSHQRLLRTLSISAPGIL